MPRSFVALCVSTLCSFVGLIALDYFDLEGWKEYALVAGDAQVFVLMVWMLVGCMEAPYRRRIEEGLEQFLSYSNHDAIRLARHASWRQLWRFEDEIRQRLREDVAELTLARAEREYERALAASHPAPPAPPARPLNKWGF